MMTLRVEMAERNQQTEGERGRTAEAEPGNIALLLWQSRSSCSRCVRCALLHRKLCTVCTWYQFIYNSLVPVYTGMCFRYGVFTRGKPGGAFGGRWCSSFVSHSCLPSSRMKPNSCLFLVYLECYVIGWLVGLYSSPPALI